MDTEDFADWDILNKPEKIISTALSLDIFRNVKKSKSLSQKHRVEIFKILITVLLVSFKQLSSNTVQWLHW